MTDVFDSLYGNGQLKAYIKSKISEGTLPHALIFEGASGSGKLTVALMTAAALSVGFEDKILRQLSPDVTVHGVSEGKKSIGISVIRDIRAQAYIKPQELQNRIFIIKNAQLLTTEAQNALLKIFEEPPKGVHFFLLCENATSLLPTVRSRAPVLRMSIFDDAELKEYIIPLNKKAETLSKNSPEAFDTLIRSCGGSIGCALERLGSSSSQAENIRERTNELIMRLSEGKNDGVLLFFVKNKFQRDELDLILLNTAYAMRDMLKSKYGTAKHLLYFSSQTDAENFAAEFARSTLMNLYSAIEQQRASLSVNVNAEAFSVRVADILCETMRK